MALFQRREDYASEPTPLSDNRRRLAELLDARDSAAAESKVLAERIARLSEAQAEVARINDDLVALNIAEQAAMLAWANSDDGSDAPTPDTARRQELEIALARARAKAAASDGATRSVASEAQRVNERLGTMQP